MKISKRKAIEDTLSKEHLTYVLITCDKPDKMGEMNVQMTHEGDPDLVLRLLEDAEQIVESGQNNPAEIVPFPQASSATGL